jgi:DNA-binding HxlR family transcriptional regulator
METKTYSFEQCLGSLQAEEADQLIDALSAMSDRWRILIILALQCRPLRFNELQRRLSTITHRVLTYKLRQLQHDGLIERRVFSQVPARVEYSLSESGRSLLPILKTLAEWKKQHVVVVPEASLTSA